jgi:hypothetical protein
MTTPNIMNTATITGYSNLILANNNTTLSTLVANANGSNQLIKVNTIYATNYSTNTVGVFVDIYRGSVSYPLAAGTAVPYNSLMILTGKDTTFYLQEGDVLRGNSTFSNSTSFLVSYEIIT